MNKSADFYCYGLIGEADPLFQIFTGSPDPVISSQKVSDFINALDKDVDHITVHINSRGGSVDEGFAIHDLFVNSGRNITTLVEGQCASIATVVMLAGQKRKMTENSTLMIHNPWIDPSIIAGLTADDLQKMTNDVRVYENRITDFYVKATGAGRDQLVQMMKDEAVLTSDKALEMKFATEIKTPVKAYAYFKYQTIKNQDNSIMNELEKKFNAFATKIENLVKGKGFKILALDVTTSDGQSLTVSDDDADGMPSVGDKVTGADGNPFASQTAVELGDKSKITTDENGVITEVIAPASDANASSDATAAAAASVAPTTPDPKDEQIKNLTEQNVALQAQIESFKGIEAKMEARINALAKSISSDATIENGTTSFNRQQGAATTLNAEQTAAAIAARNKKK